jgi:sugar lactone lactonase YvrE
MHRTLKVLADGFGFLESPRYHAGALWVCDLGGQKLLRFDAEGRAESIAAFPAKIGGLGFLPDDTPLVVSMEERVLYRVAGNELQLHADLRQLSGEMLNDMVVDKSGRAYVGNSGYNPFAGQSWTGCNFGSILAVEPDGQVREVARDLGFPNGCLITSGNRLVVAETRLRRLTSYAIDSDGSLGDRRQEAHLDGDPDGCCLDEDGGIWVGLGKTEKFVRVKYGRVVQEILTPGRKAVACQLGGRSGKTLFCIPAVGEVSQIGRALLSRLEMVEIDFAAAGSP